MKSARAEVRSLFLSVVGNSCICLRTRQFHARKLSDRDATNRFIECVVASRAAVPISLAALAVSVVFSGWMALTGGVR